MRREDPDKLLADVGRRIVELRHACGWTRDKFAEAIESSNQYAARLESGTANVTLRTLHKVANALGVRVANLLEAPSTRATPIRRGRPKKRARKPE